MLELNNQYNLVKRRVHTEVVKEFLEGRLEADVDKIPFRIIPKDAVPSRCCIYKERAMVRYRIMALLGVNIEQDDDELKPLSAYVHEALEKDAAPVPVLTTIATACSACPRDQFKVSDACRGCFARPCLANCPRDAIVFKNGQACIDQDRCVRCGKCMEVCPFHSIIHIPVPCEGACPVNAIRKNEKGFVEIDYTKCISCGNCARSCPFGAIVERSGLFPVLKMLNDPEMKTVAMIAPAIDGQFPGTLGQIKAALLEAGFDEVAEVSEGAETTSVHEAKEVVKRLEEGEPFMTTSCCPAYMELVARHQPYLKTKCSDAQSPMAYTADICRQRYPGYKTIFIGPCLAKRIEAVRLGTVDGVITFSELAALFIAKDIDVREMEEADMGKVEEFQDCRNFALTSGVAGCVVSRVKDQREVRTMCINGLDKKTVKMMGVWEQRPPVADLVEVMTCEGGCINGPGCIVKPALAMRLRNGRAVTPVKSARTRP